MSPEKGDFLSLDCAEPLDRAGELVLQPLDGLIDDLLVIPRLVVLEEHHRRLHALVSDQCTWENYLLDALSVMCVDDRQHLNSLCGKFLREFALCLFAFCRGRIGE